MHFISRAQIKAVSLALKTLEPESGVKSGLSAESVWSRVESVSMENKLNADTNSLEPESRLPS